MIEDNSVIRIYLLSLMYKFHFFLTKKIKIIPIFINLIENNKDKTTYL